MKITYIIYSHQNKAVKIGYASDLASRISALQISTPEKLSLIFAFEGGKETEKALHTLLHKYRLRGEWFVYNEEVLSVLLNYQKTCVDALTFTPKTDKVLNNCSQEETTIEVLNKADFLYARHRSKKVTIPEIKKELPYNLDSKVIKKILLDAGWITVKQGSCKTLFFTQPEVTL